MDDENKSGVVLFGRDISKIPCFRNTFLYSISSWVGVSLVTFLVTSKPQLANHCGFASFFVVTLGYYSTCSYNYAKQRYQMMNIGQSIAITERGGNIDEKINVPKLDDA